MIDSFKNQHFFLSNFFPCEVKFEGKIYQSSEAVYQVCKCINEKDKNNFINIIGVEFKKLGRQVEIRSDWNDIKIDKMREILNCKFSQNIHLTQDLIKTKDHELIEGNYWKDYFWGVCNGKGKNILGKLLMQLREELVNKA